MAYSTSRYWPCGPIERIPVAGTSETRKRETRTVSLRLSEEGIEALDYLAQLFPDRFDGASSVLRDYSLNEALALFNRAREIVST